MERSKAAVSSLAATLPTGPHPAAKRTERSRSRVQKLQASQDGKAPQLPQASQASQAEPTARSSAPAETIPAEAREVSDDMLLGCLSGQRCGKCLMCASMI